MVISNGEVMKNLVLYPPIEPSSSVEPRFTLAQNPSLMDDSELENKNIRPILTIG